MLKLLLLLLVFVQCAHWSMCANCEYDSREYQVVIRPDLVLNSFENGVTTIIDELAKIENENIMDFKVSRSSLKFKNITLVQYTPTGDRNISDFYTRPVFKSRKKKATNPADIVMKFSDIDPALICLQLTVAEGYLNTTDIKFELDIHSNNGELSSKSSVSFYADLPPDNDQTSAVNISSIFTDAGNFTRSGEPIVIVPDSAGKILMQTAEFNINLGGHKTGAEIIAFPRDATIKTEFSFRLKGASIDHKVLRIAKELTSYLSQLRTVALYAVIHPVGSIGKQMKLR